MSDWNTKTAELAKLTMDAMLQQDTPRAKRLNDANIALKAWIAAGSRGLPPMPVLLILAETEQSDPAPAVVVPLEAAPAPVFTSPILVAPPPTVASSNHVVTASPPERELQDLLNAATAADGRRDYGTAIAHLNNIIGTTHSDELRGQASRLLEGVKHNREQELSSRKAAARSIDKLQINSIAERRRGWERVQALMPDDADARQALSELTMREGDIKVRAELAELERPLQGQNKDIREVETARNTADALLNGGNIRDPKILADLKSVYDRLDKLRNDILKASEGGASSERASAFEEAIAKYRAALNAGYIVIQDDTGEQGTIIEVVSALARTRRAYGADLNRRVQQRLLDSEKFLVNGYPETAETRLKEAVALVNKIEEGDEKVRQLVQDALTKSQEDAKNKNEAQKLVTEAETDPDPDLARGKLVRAKQLYPKYPEITELLQNKERAVIGRVAQQMSSDLSFASGALGRGCQSETLEAGSKAFAEARDYCKVALERGTHLPISNDERDARRRDTQTLLDQINASEQALISVLSQLSLIDSAIVDKDVRLAKTLIEDLSGDARLRQLAGKTPDNTTDHRISTRMKKIANLGNDDDKFSEAERLFREGSYKDCETQLKELAGKSPTFRVQADKLSKRAQARLQLQLLHDYVTDKNLQQARTRLNSVIALRNDLPSEDATLVADAEKQLAQLHYFHPLFTRCTEERRKSSSLLNWGIWLSGIETLRKPPQVTANDPNYKHLHAGLDYWLGDMVALEYVTGGRNWCDSALEKAGKLIDKPAEQFNLLEPLEKAGLLEKNDPQWRSIQYAHYVALSKMQRERDLIKAEESATKAMNVASDDKYGEARRAFLEILREATLASAMGKASKPKTGAQEALDYIESRIAEWPELGLDAKIRARLLRFCIEKPDFAAAKEQARAIAFIPEEESMEAFWMQLVSAAQDLDNKKMAAAVEAVLDVRQRGLSDKSQSQLKDLEAFVRGKIETRLRASAGADSPAMTNDELVSRVQALSLLKQLNPNDDKIGTEIRNLASRLTTLIAPLTERAQNLRLRDSLASSLETGENLLSDMDAVIAALQLGAQDSYVRKVRTARDGVWEDVKKWRSAAEKLRQMDEQWAKIVMGGWWEANNINHLTALMESLQQLSQDIKETQDWEKKIEVLNRGVNGERNKNAKVTVGLRSLLENLGRAWDAENFEDFIDIEDGVSKTGFINLLTQIETRVRDMQSDLNEKRFGVADTRLTFRDLFAVPQAEVCGIGKLRARAQEKKDNLRVWTKWADETQSQIANIETLEEVVKAGLAQKPPCLSQTRDKLVELRVVLSDMDKKISLRPKTELSSKTHQMSEALPADTLTEFLQEKKTATQAQLTMITQSLEKVVPLVSKLVEYGKLPLNSTRNRKIIGDQIKKVRDLDACNPDAEKYANLLKRYT